MATLVLTATLAAVLLTAVASATSKPASSAKVTPLKVALDWFPNPDHVALFYALDKGYFKSRGLDVSLKTPSDPSGGLKLVATKRFDLAVYYQGDMFYAGLQGLPVKAVGTLVPRPLNSLIARPGGKVKALADLKGATIGSAGLPFDGAVIQTIKNKLHLGSDGLKSVNVGYSLVPALLSGKVDAVVGAYWNIEAVKVKNESGKSPVVIKMSQLGVPPYAELVIVANSKRLESDAAYAASVRAFLAGLVQGTKGARKDPMGSIALMKKSSEYSAKDLKEMMPLTLKALAPVNGTKVGCIATADWKAFGAWMLKTKLLKKAVDSKTISTTKYLAGC